MNRVPIMRVLTESVEIDDSAIRADLEWKPPFSVEVAMQRTADWYLNR